MRAARRLWHELTRPRGPVRHRFYRGRRRSRAGVALLMVISSLMFLTVMVTEISFQASVRLQLAAHQRDEAKAEALARTGVDVYRLVLSASKGIGQNPMIAQYTEMLGINVGDALWQMVPFINTGLMRMLFVSGGDLDDIEGSDTDGEAPTGSMRDVDVAQETLTDEQLEQSRESRGLSDKNFLDFEGDFFAEVDDEDRKINVGAFTATNRTELMEDPTGVKLYGLMSGTRTCPADLGASATTEEREDIDAFFYQNNLDPWQLIGNLADWTDADNSRVWDGGSEDALYNNLERDPYLPKNAPFDTIQEIRLVDQWHRDDVWERFGDSLTIYGTGKVNINTADCGVMWALLKSYVTPRPSDGEVERLMRLIQEQMAMQSFSSGRAFTTFLEQQGVTVDPNLSNAVTTESKVFRVTSTGQVGDATVTIEAVIDYSNSMTGDVRYWRVQ